MYLAYQVVTLSRTTATALHNSVFLPSQNKHNVVCKHVYLKMQYAKSSEHANTKPAEASFCKVL